MTVSFCFIDGIGISDIIGGIHTKRVPLRQHHCVGIIDAIDIGGGPYCELPRKRWGAKITLHIMEGQDIVKLFQLTLRRI